MAESKGFANLDNEDLAPQEAVGAARIDRAGVHTNVYLSNAEFTEYPSKDKNSTQKFKALKLEFTNEDGETHQELIFEPNSDPDEVKWNAKKFTTVDGKKVESGKLSNQEMVVVTNNDVVHFLLDLIDALGYSYDKGKSVLSKAEDFESLCKLFIKHFPSNEKKRISMKLLWDNNEKQQKSYLKLKGMLSYYPYKADIFEVYIPDRKPTLFIGKYEAEKKMKPMFDNSNAPAAGSGTSRGTTSSDTYTGTTKTSTAASDDDPF